MADAKKAAEAEELVWFPSRIVVNVNTLETRIERSYIPASEADRITIGLLTYARACARLNPEYPEDDGLRFLDKYDLHSEEDYLT